MRFLTLTENYKLPHSHTHKSINIIFGLNECILMINVTGKWFTMDVIIMVIEFLFH
jgi:hypothetical protein